MQNILTMIDQSDAASLLALIGLLAFVGSKMTEHDAALRQWGRRIAAGAFVAYGVLGIAFLPAADVQDWLHVAFRGLLAAGLALGLAWVLLPVGAFLLRSLSHARSRVASQFHKRRPETTSRPVCHEPQPDYVLRHSQEQSRRQDEAVRTAEAKRRRADARAKAALTFSLFAAKLQSRFRQEMFDDFLAKYMADDQAPEDVERHGAELLQTLQKHLEETQPPENKQTLEELAQWYADEKARIEKLPIDAKVKRFHTAELATRYAELASRLMEDIQP